MTVTQVKVLWLILICFYKILILSKFSSVFLNQKNRVIKKGIWLFHGNLGHKGVKDAWGAGIWTLS